MKKIILLLSFICTSTYSMDLVDPVENLHINSQENLNTGLVECIKSGDEHRAIDLLDRGANPNAMVSASSGMPPFSVLLLAMHWQRWQTSNVLIGKGADVNFTWCQDTTPILLATMHGQANTVKMLLDHGAQLKGESRIPELGGMRVHTLFDIAQKTSPEIFQLLQEAQAHPK